MDTPTSPRLGANAVILDGNRILLLQREDFHIWCLPGGLLELGESAADGVIREVHEETGIHIELVRLVGVYSRPYWIAGAGHVLTFLARPVGGALQHQPDEALDARYFDVGALPDVLLWGHRCQIADALSGVGGSAVRSSGQSLPVDWSITSRWDLYERRDKSGLPRDEFYRNMEARVGQDEMSLDVDEIRSPACD